MNSIDVYDFGRECVIGNRTLELVEGYDSSIVLFSKDFDSMLPFLNCGISTGKNLEARGYLAIVPTPSKIRDEYLDVKDGKLIVTRSANPFYVSRQHSSL